MSPTLNSEKRKVVAGPSNIDGIVARVVELPSGGGRVEYWVSGKGWVPNGITPDRFVAAKPVSPELASSLGIPSDEL